MSIQQDDPKSEKFIQHQNKVESLIEPQPVVIANNLPDPIKFQNAEPIKVQKRGGGNKLLMIVIALIVIVVICSVLLIALFSNLPNTSPNIPSFPSYPISQPVTITPGKIQKDKVVYAAVAPDGTVHIYDSEENELVINLENRNWSDLSFSPSGGMISMLSAADTDGLDRNLNIYSIVDESWKTLTVFTKDTGGISEYVWASDSEILFFQDGWLHRLNVESGEIVKLADHNATLHFHDKQKSWLIVKEQQEVLVKEAVTEMQPDPSAKSANDTQMIEVEIEPKVVKIDNIFKVIDYQGTLLKGFKLSDFVSQTGGSVLNNLMSVEDPADFLVELIWYNPANGDTSFSAAKLFKMQNDLVSEVTTLDIKDEFKLLGKLTDNSFLIGHFEPDRTIVGFSVWNYSTGNNIDLEVIPITGKEKYISSEINGYGSEDNAMFGLTTETIERGLPKQHKYWFYVDNSKGELVEIESAKNYPELVYFDQK